MKRLFGTILFAATMTAAFFTPSAVGASVEESAFGAMSAGKTGESSWAIPVAWEVKPSEPIVVSPSQIPAPQIAIGLKWDVDGWAFVGVGPGLPLPNFLGTGMTVDIIPYAGARIENGAIVGGGALVFPLAVSANLTGLPGFGLEFADGAAPKFSLFFGVRW